MNWFYYISPLILQTLIWPITRPFLYFFARFEVRGLENIEELSRKVASGEHTKGVIFASNHTGELDPVLLPAGLPFLSPFMPIFYTSREQSFYKLAGWRQKLYGGWLFQIWGAHPVQAGKKDYQLSLHTHIDIVSHGETLFIFPEGRIPKTKEEGMGKAHGGVMYLADKTQAPIIPVALSGAYRITFADLFLRRRKITMEFGKPIYPDQVHVPSAIPGSAEALKNEESYAARAQVILDTVKGMVDRH